jgi:flavin-dependent thymidylate synthase
MNVRLLSYSQPTAEFASQGIDDAQELIAYCARVSNPSNQFNTDTSEKLIRYLVRHQHWSPLEMVSACMEITTTRDIARQILRHRSFSFQEFSQRYADPTKDLEFVLREARLQDPKNRQNSIEVVQDNPEARRLAQDWERAQTRVKLAAIEAYNWAIEQWHCQGTGSCCVARRHDEQSTVHEWHTAIMDSLYRTAQCKWHTKRTSGCGSGLCSSHCGNLPNGIDISRIICYNVVCQQLTTITPHTNNTKTQNTKSSTTMLYVLVTSAYMSLPWAMSKIQTCMQHIQFGNGKKAQQAGS